MRQIYLNGLTYRQYDFKRVFEDDIRENGTPTYSKRKDHGEWVLVVNGRDCFGFPYDFDEKELTDELNEVVQEILAENITPVTN